MRYLSVCSGIEAATVAWHPLGWRATAYSEIDPFASAVLASHYPDVPNVGDMERYCEWQFSSTVDLLVGGTPCQSFSIAGLRGGLADPRGNLALVYLGLVEHFSPRWVVWENVPGVLSADRGRAFGSFLGGLAQLGYGWAYAIRDAQFYGVAQRRRRVFVIGYLGDWRRAAAVLFDSESLLWDSAPRREARQSAPTIPSQSSAGGGLGTDFDCDGGLIAGVIKGAAIGREPQNGPQFGETLTDGSCFTLNCTEVHAVSHSLRADGFDASEDGTGRGIPLVPIVGSLACNTGPNGHDAGNFASNQGVDAGYIVPVTSPALKARDYKGPSSDGDGDGACLVPIAFSSKDHGADAGETSPTLRACGHAAVLAFDPRQIHHPANYSNPKPGDPCHPLRGVANCEPAIAFDLRGRDGGAMPEGAHDTANIRAASGGSSRSYIAKMRVRRLTPRECERLQGFPDDYTAIKYRGKAAADGPRYKALGNSMAVPVMRWIGERIAAVDGLEGSDHA